MIKRVTIVLCVVIVVGMLLLFSQGGGASALAPTFTSTPDPLDLARDFNGGNIDWTPVVNEVEDMAVDMPMVLVPAGCFDMGSTQEQIDRALQMCESVYGTGRCSPNPFLWEAPQHRVCFSEPFWIGQTEITNDQYRDCVEAEKCSSPIDTWYFDDPAYGDYPVVFLDWMLANNFARVVGCQIPTEAQWEYAARGPDGWEFPWGNVSDCTLANSNDDSDGCDGYQLAPVGSFPGGASWVGALDMGGNVYEWIADAYGPYSAQPQTDPAATESGDGRTIRGGSWIHEKHETRGAYRAMTNMDSWKNYIGFRIVCPAY